MTDYLADRHRHRLVASVAGLGVSCAVALATAAPVAADPLGQITEFPIPTQASFPTELISGAGGNVWFTEDAGNKIGEVTPTGAFTEFPLPQGNSQPLAIANGPDGNLWFTEWQGNRIGRITPTGVITEFSVPTANSNPDDITNGPDGNLWFTEAAGSNIAKISTTGTITEFAVPTPGSPLLAGSGIGAGPDFNLWFTEGSANKVGRITPAGTITEFAVPTVGSRPNKIEPGPDGNLWFTEFNTSKIARSTPAGAITEFVVPTPNSGPNDLRAGPDGRMWFTEYTAGVNKVASITMSGAFTEYAVPTPNSQPGGIAPGPDGNMWFTEDAAGKVAKIGVQGGPPPGSVLFGAVQRLDTIDVGGDTNSVSATTLFPNAPACSTGTNSQAEAGCRNWQFQVFNQGGTTLTGAQVAVDSTSTGLALNDPSQFDFHYSTSANGPGSGPPSTPCPPPSLHQETCPVPGATLPANGALNINSSQGPQQGVAVPGMTTGFDSARLVSPPNNGISTVAVPVTLRDASRFAQPNELNSIGLASFNSNVVPGSATITGPSGQLAPCPAFGGAPPGTACANPPNYQACVNTGCQPGQVCTAVFAGVQGAQLNETYTITFQEYVANSNSPATSNCGSVKTALRIGVSTSTTLPNPSPCCAATVSDPTLGAVTFSVEAGQSAAIQAQLMPGYVIQYAPESQLRVETFPMPAFEGVSVNGQVANFNEDGTASTGPGDYVATIDWGDGSTSPGTITGPAPFGGFSVSGAHIFTDEGTHPVNVSVTDLDTPWNVGTGSAPGRVNDAPLSAPAGQIFGAIFPVTNSRVATFDDANSLATCADFNGTDLGPNGDTPGSITVTWDGTTRTAGTCVQTGSGAFVVTASNPSAQLGPHSVAVTIVDDGGQAVSATNTVYVGAFPANGSFVVGNLSDSGGITFWGGRWAQSNALSTGPAPGQFKGFEDGSLHPTACGGSWTSGPGNSSTPPATIPRWMAVLASSSISAANNVISGDIASIMIVDTAASGYAANPGATGTATVVAMVCP